MSLGVLVKVFKAGVVIQMITERKKFRKWPCITITHVQYKMLNRFSICFICKNSSHCSKVTDLNRIIHLKGKQELF